MANKGQYRVVIQPVDNGLVVEAGCITLVFNSNGALLSEIARWLENPREVEEEYAKKYRGDGGPRLDQGRMGYSGRPGEMAASMNAASMNIDEAPSRPPLRPYPR